ncbi:hypothetical protein HY439_01360 [Candidatus Microgenomates bacterium]|nr:hypothetical protein [Candidatus Microgenomates bacterium]
MPSLKESVRNVLNAIKKKEDPKSLHADESVMPRYEAHREKMREAAKNLFSRTEPPPTLGELKEYFNLAQGLPTPTFDNAYKVAKERNVPEYQEAVEETRRLLNR